MSTAGRDRDELARLVGLVHDVTADIDTQTSALALFREARDVAEERIPGPLGVAVAAALAHAAYGRATSPLRSVPLLGASTIEIALAVAVLGLLP